MCTMLLAKKTLTMPTTSRSSRKELEQLYARRSAIDALIQSLQEYDRYRAKRSVVEVNRRKTA